MKFILSVLLAVSLSPVLSHASNFAGYGKVGTNGFGLGVATSVNGNLGLRAGFDTFKFATTQKDANGDYGIDFKLLNVSGLADWYPWAGKFRTTFGGVYNGNKAGLTAKPTAGTYTFNGQTYSSADVGSFSGEMTFNSFVPYFGLGWGNPAAQDKQWGMTMDVGMLFQGAPKISNTVTCGTATNPTVCAQMKNDVAAGATKLEGELKTFKILPVLSVGVSYRF
ncbi:MAG: hypothetical protein AAB278_03670 [Pseudomonadota bacterium]